MSIKKSGWINFLAIVLAVVGCLQLAGYFLKSRTLRGLGFASASSPLPTVFSAVQGVEGFNTQHVVFFTGKNGKLDSIPLDKKYFSRFRGSYFLKSSFFMLLAYPHVLKKEQAEAGIHFLLCEKNLLKQAGYSDSVNNLQLCSRRLFYGEPQTNLINDVCRQ